MKPRAKGRTRLRLKRIKAARIPSINSGRIRLVSSSARRTRGAHEPSPSSPLVRHILPYVIQAPAEAELLLQDEHCRRELAPMVMRAYKTLVPALPYKHNWHVDLLCEYLEALRAGQILRLIINMPPRYLKSLICSIAFPAWLLGHNPHERILCASYAYPLAVDLSVKCRRVLQSDWYQRTFPEVKFADDQNEKSKYETTQQGYRVATSVLGSVTGQGGTYKILDDPLDPEGAYSEAEVKKVTRWLDETWSSRNDDPKAARELVVMQRLHIHDPTAHLMAQGGWTLVKLPQEAPTQVVVKFPVSGRRVVRKKGELLHTDYFGPEQVKDAKVRLNPYGYAAQHQQEPTPVGGGRIKLEWFPRYSLLPEAVEEVVISVDTGYKKGASNPSAALVFVRVANLWHLARIYKERWTYPELKKAMYAIEDKWKGNTYLIEDKASGTSLIQELQEDAEFKGAVLPIEPEADKVTRMEIQLSQLSAGKVSLPASSRHDAWAFEFEQNLTTYPSPREWDELDALSQFLKWLRMREGVDEIVPVVPFSATQSSGWRA